MKFVDKITIFLIKIKIEVSIQKKIIHNFFHRKIIAYNYPYRNHETI